MALPSSRSGSLSTSLSTSLATGLDTALDRTVLPGFSRIGLVLRRRWWPEDPPAGCLVGRTVAVTGGNSGLGLATARGAAALGADTLLLCRSTERGERAREGLLREQPDARVSVVRCDVSDPGSVRAAADRVLADAPRLHGLVHNAGVMPPERSETDEGHELALATHVLGPHLLTSLLLPALEADGDARVVLVSSGGMYTAPLDVDDAEYTRGEYSGVTAYARTKRMQVHLAEAWAAHLQGRGVAVHSMHPGWADTPGVQGSLPGFSRVTGPILRSADEGADTAVWLLGAPETGAGLFWHDRRPRPTTFLGRHRPDRDEVARLWELCVEATGATA